MNSKDMSSISWTSPYTTTVSTIPVLNLREYKSGIIWGQNEIAENFELWMKRKKNEEDISVYSELRGFLRENRQYIKFDVFVELDKDKLCEWVKLGMKD